MMKSLLTGFDLVACLFTALALHEVGRSPTLAVVYAWNPLVVKVTSGSGHAEALMAATLAACVYLVLRRQRGLAVLTFAAAVLAKTTPVVLFPFVAKRIGIRYSAAVVAAVVAGYLPFRDAGWHLFDGLFAFTLHWQFNAGPFALFRLLSASLFSAPDLAARVSERGGHCGTDCLGGMAGRWPR